jgi:hypothetical protein
MEVKEGCGKLMYYLSRITSFRGSKYVQNRWRIALPYLFGGGSTRRESVPRHHQHRYSSEMLLQISAT